MILDADLASLYGVETRRLNEQVRRNAERFPEDFAFRLSTVEMATLMSQIATSNAGRGGRRKLALVFTEHGALMAATVLNSPQAVEIALFVVRAFVELRGALSLHTELARRVAQLEAQVARHDGTLREILVAIRNLMDPPSPRRKRIGFV